MMNFIFKLNSKKIFILLNILILNNMEAYFISNFYRASYLPDEPRIEKSKLNTLDLRLSSGNTNTGYDIYKRKTTLLSILGPENPLYLKNINNIFSNLTNIDIGRLNFTGRFSLVDFQATLYQNLSNGFFLEHTLPITNMILDPVGVCSLATLGYKENKKEYINLITNLRTFLSNDGIFTNCINYTAVSDCTSLIGWANNYEDTYFLDYIDLTFKLGVLFPTGHCTTLDNPFDIPNGYDGFWGMPISGDIAWGALDWFTYGLHIDSVILFKSDRSIPIRNSILQQGFLRDKSAYLTVDPGNIINISTYIKAEHFIFNLTWVIGYTYSHKSNTFLYESEKYQYNDDFRFDNIVNNICIDPIFRSWESHNINLLIEYDLAQEDQLINPYIGIFYNGLIHGKKVFNNSMFGGNLGINIALCF